ncbi:MAG: MATE family efflux transporter [Pseudomonadota bacterium]
MAEKTTASAPLTHRRILKIAVPIVLSNATVPILGVVDTGVVGQMGDAAPIGAVGIGAIVITAIYWVFGFLRMGTTGLVSQAIGSGDRAEADVLLTRALLIGASAGVLLILLQWPLFALAFLVAPASAEVEELARGYMAIRVWSAPAAIALFGITGWLIAWEGTGQVLVIQLWMNGLNIVLSLLFVLWFDWGVEGVAIATFIAEWTGLTLGLWLCRGPFQRADWNDWPRVFDIQRLKRMANVNADILVRTLVLEAVFLSFMFIGSDFGDVPLAANQILLQFLHVTAHAMDGFAFAAETLVGQAMGARAPTRIRESAIKTGIWGAATVLILSSLFAAIGPTVIDLMTTAPDVRIEARTYLIYMILAPLFGCAAWMFDGIFIGATRTRDMRNMTMLSGVVYAVSAALLVPSFGNHGLWIAILISFVARGLTLGARYGRLEASAARRTMGDPS